MALVASFGPEGLRKRLSLLEIDDPHVEKFVNVLVHEEGIVFPKRPDDLVAASEKGQGYATILHQYLTSAENFDASLSAFLGSLKSQRYISEKHQNDIFHASVVRSDDDMKRITELFMKVHDEHRGFRKSVLKIAQRQVHYNTPVRQYTGKDFVSTFLDGCALYFLQERVKYVPLQRRTEHTFMLAGSGKGKSTMLSYIVGTDVMSVDPPCTVVLEGQGQMIPQLAAYDLPLDRVTWINPEWDIGLNLFDIGLNTLPSEQHEQACNLACDLIYFVFQNSLERKLGDNQEAILRAAIDLVLRIDGGNFFTLEEILDGDGVDQYRALVSDLHPSTQRIFDNRWNEPQSKKTRSSLVIKFPKLARSSTVKRMFGAQKNKISFIDEFRDRDLILLDTRINFLGRQEGAFLGKLYTAMILQTAFARAECIQAKKTVRAVNFIIDEAHEYLDASTDNLMLQARKGEIGMFFATQSVEKIREAGVSEKVMDENTYTKFAAPRSKSSAAAIGDVMFKKPEELRRLPDYTFAYYDDSTGYAEVTAGKNPLETLGVRKDSNMVRTEMERRYGLAEPSSNGGASNIVDPDMI